MNLAIRGLSFVLNLKILIFTINTINFRSFHFSVAKVILITINGGYILVTSINHLWIPGHKWKVTLNIFMHDDFLFMDGNFLFMHENIIFMHKNEMFMHENEMFMHEIFIPQFFHAWNRSCLKSICSLHQYVTQIFPCSWTLSRNPFWSSFQWFIGSHGHQGSCPLYVSHITRDSLVYETAGEIKKACANQAICLYSQLCLIRTCVIRIFV